MVRDKTLTRGEVRLGEEVNVLFHGERVPGDSLYIPRDSLRSSLGFFEEAHSLFEKVASFLKKLDLERSERLGIIP
ncbi:MAG: hypothetical protein K8R91_04220 [Phycisphaerae bacterium]|nr:hypothetical protein [Phycisphaerae bacterium]